MTKVRSTPDAFIGLDDATPEAWAGWHRAMLDERARVRAAANIGTSVHDDPTTAWSDLSYRQFFLFMYDESFFDRTTGRYRAKELVARLRGLYGRIDSVLLWHAYPRLGFDERTQFDFYRDMPGGLHGLRSDVVDVFHSEGIKVFVDYNPWATGTFDELAEIVQALDADGVMLDTMTDLPEDLARAVGREGVVFAPELRPRDEELRHVRQSWAQWFDIGDASTPSIHRHRWIEPRHRQLVIARWDTSRRRDIVYSFFTGSGLILWDNVFGSWNPYSPEDRRLLAETSAVLDAYGDLIAHGEWLPLVPTGVSGLDANVWRAPEREIMILRNRTNETKTFRPPSEEWRAFRGERGSVAIEPGGTQAIVRDDDRVTLDRVAEAFELAGYDERAPRPRLVSVPAKAGTASTDAEMVDIPGGPFRMKVRHERREHGCFDDHWGWFYKDVIEHETETTLEPFAIRARPVTNAEFVAFVAASGYRPTDPARFLAHLPNGDVPADLADRPVTHVSLDDARAFASFHGHRLPTEAEWQRAGLSADEWELTESEHSDGHTRFVFLRGGSPLPERESEWMPERGKRPIDSHVKYLLLADGIDRASTITFRTVKSQ